MAETWFTSDTHFGHENIISFCKRPFKNVKEMNEALLTYWNETVAPDDTVYHLGDVAMGHFDDSWDFVRKLHGKIHLVIGNHDRIAKRYHMSDKYIIKYSPLYAQRFESSSYESEWEGYTLHHFPHEGDHTSEERFKQWRPVDKGRPVIHGHVHEEWQIRGRQLNVGVDVWGYKPVHADVVLQTVRVLDPHYGIFPK